MTRSFLGRIAAGCAAIALLAGAPLPAAAYSSLVIFGDSLSDSGNNALVLGADGSQVITGNSYVPLHPYGSGTYSNGAVWATSFAAALGLEAAPSLAGGTNYAFGGAETRGIDFPYGLRRQVHTYLDTGAADAADALFVIAGGGNNARSTLDAIAGGAPLYPAIARAARRYAIDVGLMVDRLQGVGAENIVVWNTPNIGLTPAALAFGPDAAGLATLIATQMNAALTARLAGETGVTVFDIFGLVGDAVADPGAYDLANVTDACGAVVGCDPSSYLFWDGIHPTSAGHAIIADGMLAAVVPEPQTAWLLGGGIVVLLAWRRRAAVQSQ